MSQFLIVISVALAGGAGAVARYMIDVLTPTKNSFPTATYFINLSGSFLAGLALGLVVTGLPPGLSVVISSGFLGGYTTFSATSLQLALLLGKKKFTLAFFIAITQLIFSVLLVYFGFKIAAG